MLSKGRKILAASTICAALTCSFLQPGLKAQNRLQTPQTEIGFEVEGTRNLNFLIIPVYRYIGECPGESIGTTRAMFTSNTTTPSSGLRVVVRNVTRGVSSDPFPYTDRNYNRGRSSEGISVTFGSRHKRRYFVVMPGTNDFEYEIKQNKTVIERGSFIAQARPSDPIIQERNTREVEEEYCATGQPMSRCSKENIRVRTVSRCP